MEGTVWYMKHPTCYVGEVEELFFAFVPGSKEGIVLLDKCSGQLLLKELVAIDGVNQARVDLLLRKGLLVEQGKDIPLSARLADHPARILGTWLHVTNGCNLSCPYCYIHKDDGHMSEQVATAYVDKLVATAQRHGLCRVAVRLAGGEPTLRQPFVETLVYQLEDKLKAREISLEIVLITNGVLLNAGWINFIAAHGVQLCISLDGVGPMHDRTRSLKNGRGTFDTVWEGIQLCKRHGVRPTILSTITEDNLDGVTELNRWLVDNDLRFRYGVYRDTTGGYQGYQGFIQHLTPVLEECYDYYEDAIRSDRAAFHHQLADIRIDNRPHYRCCGVGHSSITVAHNGEVHLCQSRMSVKPIGTVWDDRDLLMMARQQTVLEDLNGRDVYDYARCCDCQWALTCGGGCPVVNADTFGTPLTDSPHCELFQRFIPRLIDLRALSLARTFLNKGGGRQ